MKPLDIKLRLAASFCLLAAVLFVVGWRGINHLRQLNAQMQNVVGEEWKKVQLSHKAFRLSDKNSRVVFSVFMLEDQDEIKQLLVQRAANTERISELISEIEPQLEPGKEKELFAVVKSKRTPYVESYQRALSLLLTEQKRDEARKMMVDIVRPNLIAYHTAWDAFEQQEADEIDRAIQQSKADYIAGLREFLFTLVLAGLITTGIAIFTVMRVGREIAVRQRAEQSLQQANEALQAEINERNRADESVRRLAAIVENSNDAIISKTLDGIITTWNPAAEKMFGYTASEIIGKPIQTLIPPDRFQKESERLAGFARGEIVRHLETVRMRKDGRRIDVAATISAIKDSDGRIVGASKIVRDITDRKRIEARMLQAQKMETVGKLAGGVAHEFNSILTAIIGQSELLLSDLPPDDPLVKNATEIRQAAERAAVLTRQLLAYGRKQILQPEILDLNRVLTDMAGALQHLMGREVDVRIIPAVGLKTVKIDPGQIEQVIVNMAMNAADAMPNGGKLTIETANVTLDEEYVRPFFGLKAGGYVRLAVSDTGVGMSEEVKARVFEPFFSTKDVGQGTGLGLATCYGILKQSDGHINVYSEVARGATFKIYLPQVEEPAKIPLPRSNPPDLPRGTETILLAEDDPSLREMSATLLRRLGYTVLTAANGVEALNLKQQRDIGHIDLLFTDVVMPHMSGKELSDRIRTIYPHTKILFTSAYTENAIVHQGILNEGVALLQKPFTPSALAHKVREVLDR
jgi:PAS domain S-box-containing protein